MRPWLVKFWPFVLITTIIIVVVPVFVFRSKSEIKIKPIENIKIDETKFNLGAVADLKGNWEGVASFKNTNVPDNYCTFTGPIKLKITSQNNNHIYGQFMYGSTKNIPYGGATCDNWDIETLNMEALLNGSRIENLSGGGYGIFSGSYTSETITLRQVSQGEYKLQLVGVANFLRR